MLSFPFSGQPQMIKVATTSANKAGGNIARPSQLIRTLRAGSSDSSNTEVDKSAWY